jgi:hypothetical protein
MQKPRFVAVAALARSPEPKVATVRRIKCESSRVADARRRQALRRAGLLRWGYRKENVDRLIGTDVLATAIERVRLSGMMKAGAEAIGDESRWRALLHFRPDVKATVAGAAALKIKRPPVLRVRLPALTGIIAAPSDPLFDAVSAAVGHRMSRDIRLEAISLTTMDYLEGRIGMDDIPAAARKHVAALHREQKYTRSIDEPRYRDGDTARVETLSESDGLWARS